MRKDRLNISVKRKGVKQRLRKRDRLRKCPVCKGGIRADPARCARCKALDALIAKRHGRRAVEEGAIQYGPYHDMVLTREPINRQEV